MDQLEQLRMTLNAGNSHRYRYRHLLGITLIEIIVTVAIIALLAGLTLANISTIQRPQDAVDSATDFIENLLNQANSTSITANQPQYVCSYTKGTGVAGSFATCNSSLSANTTSSTVPWGNVNGSIFKQVNISVTGQYTVGQPSNSIYYSSGLVSNVLSNSQITISITSTTKPACTSTITIWPNGVLNIISNTNTC